MSQVNVALIGAGMMANLFHYPSLKEFDDVKIVALCDLLEDKLAQTAEAFDIERTYTDYRKMLDDTKPDAVYVLMPPHQVFDVAADVLERGLAMFVEKPPAVTSHQAKALARLAGQNKSVTAVGWQRRYHPMARQCWQEVCDSQPVRHIVATFYKSQPPADIHPYYRGAIDILHSDAIHAVDSLRFYTGLSDVTHVAADVRHSDTWFDTSYHAIVTFDNGTIGILLANWRSGRRLFRLEFHHDGRSAEADLDLTATAWADGQSEPLLHTTPAEAAGSQAAHIVNGFMAENRAFLDAVKSGKDPHNNLSDAVKTMELADQIEMVGQSA